MGTGRHRHVRLRGHLGGSADFDTIYLPQQDTNSAGLPAQSAEVSRATANAGAADGNWLGNLLEEIGILLLPIAPELTPFFLEAGEIVNAIPFPSIVGDEFCLLDGLLAWYAMIGSINNINSMGTGIIGAEKNLGILPELGSAAAAAAPHQPTSPRRSSRR